MFDSMIKTFSQKAYINDGGELSIAPPVSVLITHFYPFRISNPRTMTTVKTAKMLVSSPLTPQAAARQRG